MDIFKIASIISVLIFITGLFGIAGKIRLPSRETLKLKITFTFLAIILALAGLLSVFKIYFRGYWTTKILIWLFILIASVLFAFCDRQAFSKRWRVLTGSIFYFPVTSLVWFFMAPFMGPLFSIAIWGHILGDPDDIFYSDNDIRIQTVFKGPLAPAGPPNYFKKSGVLEFDQGPLQIPSHGSPDSLKVEKTKDSITVYFYSSNHMDSVNPVLIRYRR